MENRFMNIPVYKVKADGVVICYTFTEEKAKKRADDYEQSCLNRPEPYFPYMEIVREPL